jgi:formylglycine-generating enzyme required for sulfatase activity
MLMLFTFAALTLLTGTAAAQRSVGNYSGCKKLAGSAKDACLACVGGGNFYQTESKTCGLAPGMKKSKPMKAEPPPPKPKKMPKHKYVTVPAGTFLIGAVAGEDMVDARKEIFDKASVTISRPFLMKTTEVTNGEWYFIMGSLTSSYGKDCGLNCPVGEVSWRKALEYLNKLSKEEGLEQCYDLSGDLAEWKKGVECTGYRLPTQAEWEYAARGGTEGQRYGELDDIAWYDDNSGDAAHPVGKKAPNAYGLYDMIGNVWEWTWDAEKFDKSFVGEMTDPIIGGLSQGDSSEAKSRVIRGGSFHHASYENRATRCYQFPVGSGMRSLGFRPVRTVSAKK